MIDNTTLRASTSATQPLRVGIASNEPSHIHIPRPSRVMRQADDAGSDAQRQLARLEEHLDARREGQATAAA